MGSNKLSIIKLALAMTIFGTIGLFTRFIPLPSSVIAVARGLIGTLILLLVLFARRQKLDSKAIRTNLVILMISGIAIGINWVFLFEAYRYTTVAKATLSYYLAPVFVTMAAPIFLKEKLTIKKMICIITALVGMAFVSGVIGEGINPNEIKGILFGTLAAILYATVIILNKKLRDIGAYDMTIIQLFVAAICLLPYVFMVEKNINFNIGATGIVMLILIGVIHTGIAYALYFSSMGNLKAQTIAIFSYIDPIVAIILSSLFLNEKMGIYGIIGAVLILGSTYISERGE